MIDFNTLKFIKHNFNNLINIQFYNNDDIIIYNKEYCEYLLRIFNNKHFIINDDGFIILSNSFNIINDSILLKSSLNDFILRCKDRDNGDTTNSIIINDKQIYIDIYIMYSNDIIYYYDVLLNNNLKNIISLKYSLDDYILLEKILKKYSLSFNDIIHNINTLFSFTKIELNLDDTLLFEKNFNNYCYTNIINKFLDFNGDSFHQYFSVIDNIKTNIYKNNIIFNQYSNDNLPLFTDNNLKSVFHSDTIDQIYYIKNHIYNYSNDTDNYSHLNLKNYKKFNVFTNLNTQFNIPENNTFFMYNFYRLKKLNNLIPDDITLNSNTDITKLIYIKPKLLFNNNVTPFIENLYFRKKCNEISLIKDLFSISFYILYCILSKDYEYIYNKQINGINIITLNSPYIHKLSDIGSHFTKPKILNYDYIYKYIHPITYGYYLELQSINSNINNDNTGLDISTNISIHIQYVNNSNFSTNK